MSSLLVRPYAPDPSLPWLDMMADNLSYSSGGDFADPRLNVEMDRYIYRDVRTMIIAALYGVGALLFLLVILTSGSSFVSYFMIVTCVSIVIFGGAFALDAYWHLCHPPGRHGRVRHLVAFVITAAVLLLVPTTLLRNDVVECEAERVAMIRAGNLSDPEIVKAMALRQQNCVDTIDFYAVVPFTVVGCVLQGNAHHVAPLVPLFFGAYYSGFATRPSPDEYRYEVKPTVVTVQALVTVVLAGLGMVFVVAFAKINRERFVSAARAEKVRLAASEELATVDTLLQATLPESVLQRVAETGDVAAIDDVVVNATVLFTDLAGFTAWSSSQTATAVVQMLNTLCLAFDDLVRESEGVEKVKTIGDAYWAMSGLPEYYETHATAMAWLGSRMQRAMSNINRSHRAWGGLLMRVGVHSGPLRAAIFGTLRLSYEPFGETCRIAQMAEAKCSGGRVVITSGTRLALLHEVAERHSKKLLNGTPPWTISDIDNFEPLPVFPSVDEWDAVERADGERSLLLVDGPDPQNYFFLPEVHAEGIDMSEDWKSDQLVACTPTASRLYSRRITTVTAHTRASAARAAAEVEDRRQIEQRRRMFFVARLAERNAVVRRRAMMRSQNDDGVCAALDQTQEQGSLDRQQPSLHVEVEPAALGDGEEKAISSLSSRKERPLSSPSSSDDGWRLVLRDSTYREATRCVGLHMYADPELEDEYQRFAWHSWASLRRWVRLWTIVVVAALYVGIVVPPVPEYVPGLVPVLAMAAAFVLAVAGAIFNLRSDDARYRTVEPFAAYTVAVLLVVGSGFASGSVVGNDPAATAVPAVMIGTYSCSVWSPLRRTLLSLAVCVATARNVVQQRGDVAPNTIALVLHVMFAFLLHTLWERQTRQQFKELRQAEALAVQEEEAKAAQKATLANIVPEHVLPELGRWLQEGCDPSRSIVRESASAAVCFVRLLPCSFQHRSEETVQRAPGFVRDDAGLVRHPFDDEMASWLVHGHRRVDSILRGCSSVEKVKTVGDIVVLAGPLDPEGSALAQPCVGSGAMEDGGDAKTLGDSLFASASGSHGPDRSPEVREALGEILGVLQELRIAGCNLVAGVHVGPLVGAVLGTERLCFDIFGDTVNTTSRIVTSVPLPTSLDNEDAEQAVEMDCCRHHRRRGCCGESTIGLSMTAVNCLKAAEPSANTPMSAASSPLAFQTIPILSGQRAPFAVRLPSEPLRVRAKGKGVLDICVVDRLLTPESSQVQD